MNARNWVLGILVAGLVAGCGQKKEAPSSTATTINGVKVDVIGFQRALADVPLDLHNPVLKICMSIRQEQYPDAIAELEKLVANPALTEPQKKAASDLLQQLKQAAGQPHAWSGQGPNVAWPV